MDANEAMKMLTTTKGRTQIRYIGLALPDVSKDMMAAVDAAMRDTIVFWRQNFAPKHFTGDAFSRYGGREPRVYEHRVYRGSAKQRSDNAPNVAPFRHRDFGGSLVQPGGLRKAFLSGGMKINWRNKSKGGRIVVATWPGLPRYTYVDLYGKNRVEGPKKYLELTITNEAEAAEMEKYLAARIEVHLQEMANGQEPAEMAA